MMYQQTDLSIVSCPSASKYSPDIPFAFLRLGLFNDSIFVQWNWPIRKYNIKTTFKLIYFYASPQRVSSRCQIATFLISTLVCVLHVSAKRTRVSAGKVALAAFVWFFSAVCFEMSSQFVCLNRGIITLAAFVWFFSFLICDSEENIYIDPTFIKVVISKMLIHHHQFGIVGSFVLPVSNWENKDCR